MSDNGQTDSRAVTMKSSAAILVWAVGILCSLSLRADTFFSNLGLATNVSFGYNIDSPSYRLATDFLTGPSATTVTNATLKLASLDSIGHNFTLSLFTGSGSNTPASLVGSFNSTFLPALSPQTNYSFSSSGISLAPNTAYWAVLQINENIQNTDSYWWGLNNQATDAGSVFSTISGTSIELSRDSGATWTDGTTGNFWFSLSGTLVPEPAAFDLVAMGLLGLYFLRRSKP
jgi:hypothetical protein